MRIRCPSCSATYEVPATLLDNPRTVRCARCAHDWMAEPIAEAPEPEPRATEAPPTEPPQEPIPDPMREREPVAAEVKLTALDRLAAPAELSPVIRRRDRWLTTAWAASFAALAALGVAGYTERDHLMREWPASKRVYASLGLAANVSDAARDQDVGPTVGERPQTGERTTEAR
jgi:predicted Zn finger-like uncharacterized protein